MGLTTRADMAGRTDGRGRGNAVHSVHGTATLARIDTRGIANRPQAPKFGSTIAARLASTADIADAVGFGRISAVRIAQAIHANTRGHIAQASTAAKLSTIAVVRAAFTNIPTGAYRRSRRRAIRRTPTTAHTAGIVANGLRTAKLAIAFRVGYTGSAAQS